MCIQRRGGELERQFRQTEGDQVCQGKPVPCRMLFWMSLDFYAGGRGVWRLWQHDGGACALLLKPGKENTAHDHGIHEKNGTCFSILLVWENCCLLWKLCVTFVETMWHFMTNMCILWKLCVYHMEIMCILWKLCVSNTVTFMEIMCILWKFFVTGTSQAGRPLEPGDQGNAF